MGARVVRGVVGATLAAVLGACAGEPAGVTPAPPPVIEHASISLNPHNTLSASVSVRLHGADSVAVRYYRGDERWVAETITPASALTAGALAQSATIPLLGLLPERRYVVRALAYGAGGMTTGDSLELNTGALPADLPHYTAAGSDPTPGLVVFAAGPYGLVIDNTGRVVWYRRLPNVSLSFMVQPNGRYTARPSTPDPTDLDPWIEMDALGNITRALGCSNSLQPRLHDLIAEPAGSYWIMCDETRTMDLRAAGGVAGARVTGTAVQHIGAGGELLFHWSAFDHFLVTDLDAASLAGANVNWTHGNAIDLDADGNLFVSFRNLNEVTKIDTRTGAVLWRFGGRRNELTLLGRAAPFAGQHSARVYARDRLVLLDNIGDPIESRVERWIVDAHGSAQMVHSYGSVPSASTLIGGSVQPLADGRTLVSFGTAGRVEEYDAAGRVTWRIEGSSGYVFRAQRIRSLYRPELGPTR